jgi:hypothetical protein
MPGSQRVGSLTQSSLRERRACARSEADLSRERELDVHGWAGWPVATGDGREPYRLPGDDGVCAAAAQCVCMVP